MAGLQLRIIEVDETGGDGIDDEKLTLNYGRHGYSWYLVTVHAGHGFGIDAVKNFLPGADTPAVSHWVSLMLAYSRWCRILLMAYFRLSISCW